MNWIIIQLVFFLPTCTISTFSPSNEANIISNITNSYQNFVRPSETTIVSISFGLLSVADVNTVTQEFSIMGFVIAEWQDSRLAWDPADYLNTGDIMIKTDRIWTPPLLINNAADSIRMINDDQDLVSIYSSVDYDGNIKWLTPVNVISSCDINISKYPFDKQTCEIIMSSWMFMDFQISFNSGSEDVNLDLYSLNGEWDITSTSTAQQTRTLFGFPMSAVSFKIDITRKYSYYVLNMILPVVILAILGPFVFLLQNDSGYAMTVLLSMSVVMATVSDSIPPTANNVCILSVYLLVTYLVCAAETVVVVMMCHMQTYHERDYKPGGKTQRCIHFIAMVTRYRRADEEDRSNKVNSVVSVIDVINEEKMVLAKDQSKQACVKKTKDYSFDECVYILNFFNFFVFLFLTCVITIIFMLILMT